MEPIVITDKNLGKKYTLEFDAASVKFAERSGFDITSIEKTPYSASEDLFFYAFRKNHKKEVSRDYTDKMLKSLRPLPDGFIVRLVQLYTAAFDEGEEDPFVTIDM